MEDWLIDDDRLSLDRKSVLPGEGFFIPDSVDDAVTEREAAAALDGADVVVVADPDADGLGCVALIREAVGGGVLLPTGPHELDQALESVGANAETGTDVYVCDLAADERDDLDPLETIADLGGELRWFDHHQWDEDIAASVRAAGVDLHIGDSETVCSTDVALSGLDHRFDDRYADLAAVIRDHDLWIREDPRSDDIADYAHWAEPEEFIATVREHGADLPPDVQEFLADRRVEKNALIDRAVDRADIREVGPWTVGVTYGRCSQNEVAEALREKGTDAAIVVKPAGSASIRGTEAFQRCHEVARQVNGGGHPKAAGCKPDVYDDMLDYAHHWTTHGLVAKRAILDGFRQLSAEDVTGEH